MTQSDDGPRYEADADASPVDRALMHLARWLSRRGNDDDAQVVAGSAADLREYVNMSAGSADLLYQVMERAHGATEAVMNVIERRFPPLGFGTERTGDAVSAEKGADS